MKASLLTAFVLLAGLHQEPAQPRPGTGVLSGRVINAVTGAPIAGASVSLFAHDIPTGFVEPSRSLVAAHDGTFTFTAVPPGQIDLSASAITFLGGAFGRLRPEGPSLRIPLKDGERFAGATIRLWPGASTAGRVTNERGMPMSDVFVTVYRMGEAENFQFAAGSMRTDATGDYTITGLRPGRYVASVRVQKFIHEVRPPSGDSSCAPPPPPRPVGLGPAPPVPAQPPSPPLGTLIVNLLRGIPRLPPTDEGRPQTYRTTFVPGGDSPDITTAFDITAGQTRFGIDFTMRPSAGFRVEGRLIDPVGSLQGEVTLTIPEATGRHSQPDVTTFLKPDGSFVFLEVPPGRYRLSAQRFAHVTCDTRSITEPAWFGGVVDIGSNPSDTLTLELLPRTRVRGRMHYRGTARRPYVVSVQLWPVDVSSGGDAGHGDVNGEHVIIPAVLPGRYSVYVDDSSTPTPGSRPWWPESVTLEGVNVLGQVFEIGSRDLDSLVVTMTDTPSVLEGPVVASDPGAVTEATVVVFPARADRSPAPIGHLNRFERVVDGRYRFDHLPPGEYFVAAVEEAQMDGWPTAAFLDRLRPHAARIVMASGQSKVVTLQLPGR